jgi:integration host factor subunit beta
MIKSELIKMVSEEADITHEVAELAVNTIFDSMTESLGEGKGIEIRGFGSFKLRHYDGRKGRNPKTGNIISVAPKKRPFFKVGKELRERVNQEPPRTSEAGDREG